MEQQYLKELVDKKLSIREISNEVNISYSSVRDYLKKYGLKTDGYKTNNNWNKTSLIDAVSNSECKSDVLRYLNIKLNSGNFQTLDKYLEKYKINTDCLQYNNDRGSKWSKEYSNDEVFVVNSTYGRGHLKRRLVREKLIEYKCETCDNNGRWNDCDLVLQLDHINGINTDNRLQNLRFLCPNCHSQTKTYCRKNK